MQCGRCSIGRVARSSNIVDSGNVNDNVNVDDYDDYEY